MIFVGLFVSALLLVAQSSTEKKDREGLIVQNVPQFPFQLERPFEITISPKNQNDSLINSLKDTMVVQISDVMTSENEMAVFDFGFKEMIDKEFVGEFMRIPVWEANVEKRVINLTIFFTKFAHLQTLEIYHVNATTSQERRRMLQDLKLAKVLYRSKVNLFMKPEIDISVNSDRDGDTEIYQNTNNIATCRSYDGFPNLKPDFIDSHLFSNKSKVFSESKNEIEMTFNATVKHHNRNLTCQAGTTKKSVKIRVFHAPSKVTFEPEINGILYNGSSVICRASDGYPEPRITWHIQEGPTYASWYYQIKSYSQTLYIKPNAPIGSKWKFSCKSVNVVHKVTRIYFRTISFTIGKKEINRTANVIPKVNHTKESTTCVSRAYVLKSLGMQNLKMRSLNLKISKQSRDISQLKLTDKRQSSEISKLKNAIKKLEDNNKDQKETIKKLKKFVEKEIKSLKTDVVILKSGSVSKKNDKLVGEKVISTPMPKKRAPSVEWKFYKIRRMRRKRKTARSSRLYNKDLSFPVSIWLWLGERESLRVTVQMSRIHTRRRNLLMRGTATLRIYNGQDRKLYRQSNQRFQRDRRSTNLVFNFSYHDLYETQVLNNDQIIVQCSFVFDD